MSLEELYQEIIMDHYRRPRNFGDLPEGGISVEHENPACGDHLELVLRLQNGAIEQVRFAGRGCAISIASASMMTEAVKGRAKAEAESTARKFLAMLAGEAEPDGLGELAALSGVRQFPMRVKCAALAWHALGQALETSTDAL